MNENALKAPRKPVSCQAKADEGSLNRHCMLYYAVRVAGSNYSTTQSTLSNMQDWEIRKSFETLFACKDLNICVFILSSIIGHDRKMPLFLILPTKLILIWRVEEIDNYQHLPAEFSDLKVVTLWEWSSGKLIKYYALLKRSKQQLTPLLTTK